MRASETSIVVPRPWERPWSVRFLAGCRPAPRCLTGRHRSNGAIVCGGGERLAYTPRAPRLLPFSPISFAADRTPRWRPMSARPLTAPSRHRPGSLTPGLSGALNIVLNLIRRSVIYHW